MRSSRLLASRGGDRPPDGWWVCVGFFVSREDEEAAAYVAFDSFGSGGGKAWQTPAPAEKPESAAAAGHSLAPTMRVGGGPTDGCSSRPDLCGTQIAGAPRHRRDM